MPDDLPLNSKEAWPTCLKPVTHYVILYADRHDRPKSPSVSGAAIAISPIAAIGV